MSEKVIALTTSGNVAILDPERDEVGSALSALQRIVGGYIEVVKAKNLGNPYLIVCDEDGIPKGLEVNVVGTLLYGSPIVGDIVIMKSDVRNGEPDIVGMDDEEATDLVNELVASHPWLQIIVHQ